MNEAVPVSVTDGNKKELNELVIHLGSNVRVQVAFPTAKKKDRAFNHKMWLCKCMKRAL